MDQNFPNPFNATTTIHVNLPADQVREAYLIVYSALGTRIADLTDRLRQSRDLEFSSTNLPAGVYFYTIEAPRFRETREMRITK